MNQQLKQLYVCCVNNKVFIYETNLSKFHEEVMKNNEIGFNKTYRQLRGIFEKSNFFEFENFNQKYILQKLI